jgi:hypothetical protein
VESRGVGLSSESVPTRRWTNKLSVGSCVISPHIRVSETITIVYIVSEIGTVDSSQCGYPVQQIRSLSRALL